MPNGMYGGVRGKETKVGLKTFVSRPARLSSVFPRPHTPGLASAVAARTVGRPGTEDMSCISIHYGGT